MKDALRYLNEAAEHQFAAMHSAPPSVVCMDCQLSSHLCFQSELAQFKSLKGSDSFGTTHAFALGASSRGGHFVLIKLGRWSASNDVTTTIEPNQSL